MAGPRKAGGPGTSLAMAALALAAGCGLMPPEGDVGAQQPDGTPPERRTLPPPEYVQIWADEFDGAGLSAGSWTPLAAQRRDALATPEAVRVANGLLTVTTYTGADGVHRTGFISTEGKFAARYGFFEARIRFHTAPGSWCAFWLNSPTNGVPLGDPGRAGVEIDVVEHRVTDQGGWDELRDMVASALNWDGYDEHTKNLAVVNALPDGSRVQGEWHTYAVLWTESGYSFYVDGVPLWSPDGPVSHRPQEVFLTCEVEEASWAGEVPAGGYGSRASSTARMEVDWVRAWQRPE